LIVFGQRSHRGHVRESLDRIAVGFERAATIFLDPQALSTFDEEHSQSEDRWITVGLDRTGNLLVVCHTYGDETETSAHIRVISARKATRNEANSTEQNNQ